MAQAGSAFIQVIPSLDGFQQKVERDLRNMKLEATVALRPDMDRGDVEKAVEAATKGVKAKVDVDLNVDKRGVKRQVDNATKGVKGQVEVDVELAESRRELRAKLQEIISGVDPEVEVRAEMERRAEVQRKIDEATQGLTGIVDVDIDVDRAEAIAKIQAATRDLTGEVELEPVIFPDEVKRRIDAATIGLVGRVDIEPDVDEAEFAADGAQSADAFSRTFRTGLQAALSNLPNAEIDADATPAQRRVAELRAEIERLDAEIDVGIDTDQALLRLTILRAELEALLATAGREERIRFDVAEALRGLDQVDERFRTSALRAGEAGDRAGGAYGRNLRQRLDSALTNLPNIRITADSSDADREIAAIRASLAAIRDPQITPDIDSAEAMAELAALQARLRALATTSTSHRVRVDAGSALNDLNGISGAADDVTRRLGTITAAAGRAGSGMRRFGRDGSTVALAVAAALGLVGSLAATLPGMLVAAGASAGTVALGVDGIKTAFQGLTPEVNILQQEVSAAFEQGLVPTVENSRTVLMGLRDEFAQNATALAGLTNGLTEAAASVEGMTNLTGVFDGWTAALTRGEQTAFQFMRALLETANVGGNALAGMVDGLDRMILEWQRMVALGQQTGDLVGGIEGLVAVFNSLLGLIPAFIQFQLALSNAFGPPMAALITALEPLLLGIGAAVTGVVAPAMQLLTGIFTSMPSGLQGGIAALIALRLAMAAMGRGAAATTAPLRTLSTGAQQTSSAMGILRTSSSTASTALTGSQQAARAAAAGHATTAQAVRAHATAAGAASQQFLRTGGAINQMAGQAAPVPGVMRNTANAFTAAGGRAGGLANTMRGSLAGGMTFAATAARGFAGALGGPWGLAITGAVVGLSMLGSAHQDAAAKQQAHEQRISTFAQALQASGGQLDQNYRAVVAADPAYTQLSASLQEAGINTTNLGSAIVDNNGSFESMITEIGRVIESEQGWLDLGRLNNSGLSERGQKLMEAQQELRRLQAASAGAQYAYAQLEQSMRATGQSMMFGVQGGQALRGALETLGNASKTADERLKALKTAMDLFNGGTISVEQAALRGNQALTQLGQALDTARQQAGGLGPALINANGAINTTSQGGQQLATAMFSARDAMQQEAMAAFDAAGGHQNLAGATQAVNGVQDRYRNALIQTAQQMGMSAEQARQLADRYLGVPNSVSTTITANGLNQVQQEVLTLQQRLAQLKPGQPHNVVVAAITDQARQQLTQLGFTVTNLPNGQVQVSANDAAARTKLDALVAYSNSRVGKPIIDANPQQFNADLDAAIAAANAAQADPKLRLDPAQFKQTLLQMINQGNNSRAEPQLGVRPDPFQQGVQAAVNAAQGQRPTPPLGVDPGPFNAGVDSVVRSADAKVARPDLQVNPGATFVPQVDQQKKQAEATPAKPGAELDPAKNRLPQQTEAEKQKAGATPAKIGLELQDNASAQLQGIQDRFANIVFTWPVGITDNASAPLQGIVDRFTPVKFLWPLNIQDNATRVLDAIFRDWNGRVLQWTVQVTPPAGAPPGGRAFGGVQGFAGGGVLPGYAPGRDRVRAMLSPGEAVLVPELTRAIGPRNILAANAAASSGRRPGGAPGVGFAFGGLVDDVIRGIGGGTGSSTAVPITSSGGGTGLSSAVAAGVSTGLGAGMLGGLGTGVGLGVGMGMGAGVSMAGSALGAGTAGATSAGAGLNSGVGLGGAIDNLLAQIQALIPLVNASAGATATLLGTAALPLANVAAGAVLPALGGLAGGVLATGQAATVAAGATNMASTSVATTASANAGRTMNANSQVLRDTVSSNTARETDTANANAFVSDNVATTTTQISNDSVDMAYVGDVSSQVIGAATIYTADVAQAGSQSISDSGYYVAENAQLTAQSSVDSAGVIGQAGNAIVEVANYVAQMVQMLFSFGGGGQAASYGGVVTSAGVVSRTATYDSGGWLQPGLTLAYNGTGKREAIFTNRQLADIERGGGAPATSLIGHYEQHLHDSSASAEAAAQAVVYRLRQGRRGGVHQ